MATSDTEIMEKLNRIERAILDLHSVDGRRSLQTFDMGFDDVRDRLESVTQGISDMKSGISNIIPTVTEKIIDIRNDIDEVYVNISTRVSSEVDGLTTKATDVVSGVVLTIIIVVSSCAAAVIIFFIIYRCCLAKNKID